MLNALPKPIFECVIYSKSDDLSLSYDEKNELLVFGQVYDALILQLGSFVPYKLYSKEENLQPGNIIKCNLYRRYTNPISYIFLPVQLNSSEMIPSVLATQIDFIGSTKRSSDNNDYMDDIIQDVNSFVN